MTNQQWTLESFVDSLVVELDKTRETLAVKSINRPLTYTVKDMSLELQIFPTFDGDTVQFITAQPGQQGSSKLSVQLASITDQQVRATSKAPPSKEDVRIDAVELDPATKKSLRRLGVTSASDLEQIEKRDVDLAEAAPTGGAIDYQNLANVIQKARRRRAAPKVETASLTHRGEHTVLELLGENLRISPDHVPVAVMNDRLHEVIDAGPRRLVIALAKDVHLRSENDLIVTLDPYCIVRMQIRDEKSP